MRRNEAGDGTPDRDRAQSLFERQIGDALRQSLNDTAREQLPAAIRRLLEELDGLIRARGLAE
jgi:hypothetical protein